MTTRFPPTRVPPPRGSDLHLIAESVPHIAWIAASDGSTEYFNRWGCAYTGLPAYGQEWLSLVHPDDAERAQREWEYATRAGTLLDVECRMRRADGSFRWHAVRSLPLEAGNGEPAVKWIGTATDVDERRRLQDRLRLVESEPAERDAALEALHAAAPVGLALIDRELRLITANEALTSIDEAAPQDHLGRPAAEVMPVIWPQIAPLCRQVLESGRPALDQEIVGLTADGRQTWHVSCYPVRVDRELIGVGLVAADLTEQRRRADELRSVVMHNMAEGLYTSDGEGRFISNLNAAAERMLGWSEDELRGKPVHATIHFQRADGSPLPEEECELLQGPDRGTGRACVRRRLHAQGRLDLPRRLLRHAAAGEDDASGVVVVFRDTTEEKAEREHVQRELDALTWVGRTRDALDEGRLILYSQPIVPLAGGEPSEELLLRMVGTEKARSSGPRSSSRPRRSTG